MPRTLNVGAVQALITADVQENLHKVAAFIQEARRRRVELLVFPETMLSGYGPLHWKEREPDPVTLRRRVGMVFQRWNPFPKSIYDNVAYGPRIGGVKRRADLDGIVESALRRAALWEEVKTRLRDSALALSGGQQQRLCIARALANEPDVLLLDEPASALDPIATQSVEELLYELRRDLTIVIVTHNLQQAARVSDVTAFFYLGQLIESGPTDRMFTTPSNERTEAYITGRFG